MRVAFENKSAGIMMKPGEGGREGGEGIISIPSPAAVDGDLNGMSQRGSLHARNIVPH